MSLRLEGLALRAILAIVAMLVVVTPAAIIYLQVTDDAEEPVASGQQAADDDGSAATNTTSRSSTTSTSSKVADAELPALPQADTSLPPVEPIGVYKDGKVVLGGSVPRAELAAGYLEKLRGVIGADNVSMQMSLDPRVSGETMRIDVDERFQFPTGQITFAPDFEALLNLGAAALRLLPETTLVVTGHTDAVGSDATNQALSVARAQLVVDFMVNAGIPADRIVARGAGETEPIADNATPEGRQANRRIEATLEGLTPH
jgi:outer membrane protein OmpA-like peptidoglycan-associated protein